MPEFLLPVEAVAQGRGFIIMLKKTTSGRVKLDAMPGQGVMGDPMR